MVERDLPKVDVEGSNPFSRSKNKKTPPGVFLFLWRVLEGMRTLEEGLTQNCRGHKVAHEIGNF